MKQFVLITALAALALLGCGSGRTQEEAMATKALEVGDRAPDFTLPSPDGDVRLSALKGKVVVLYFYPKDATPG